jgi:predicted DNA-binding transcriptional regulator AlpA
MDDVRLPAKLVWQRYSVTDRTLDRWLTRPELRFPKPIAVINGRRYWSLAELEAWERERASAA